MLTGTYGVELIKVHKQVVGQRHLLVELVREVQVVQEILLQMLGQQATEERGLATTLRTNQRGHHLIAVQRVHLKPVGHHRAHPYKKVRELLGAEARNATEQLSHMVLSVPLGQVVQVVLDGVERRNVLRVDILLDIRLGVASLADILTFGLHDDAVQRLQGQRTKHRFLSLARLDGKLNLAVQHIATQEITVLKELLGCEHSLLRGSHNLAIHFNCFLHLFEKD